MRHARILAAILLLSLLLTACNLPFAATPTTPPPSTVPSTAETPPTATVPPTIEAWTPPEHRIQIRTGANGAEFYDMTTGETFVPRGANYIHIVNVGTHFEDRLFATDQWDAAVFRADLQALSSRGYNTVRIFIDSCNSGPTCIADPDGPGLVDGYLDNLAEAMQIAKEEGIYLQLTSNDIPDNGGYGEMSNREASDQMAGYRNAHMLTASGHAAARQFWTDLMAGLAERQAAFDAVLGWQLLNEQWLFGLQPPLSLTSGSVEATGADGAYDMGDPAQKRDMVDDAVMAYIAEMSAVIKAQDPTALVTMGFFAPDFPNATGIGGDWYVDTAALIERGPALDYYDFHAYPGSDIPLDQIAENFGMVGYTEKPVVMGELGAFRGQYETVEAGARATSQWMADSCPLGFDGWLYWTYIPAPLAIGDATWGLVDEDNYLLDLFAPNTWTDPCTPVEVPNDNLAYGAAVTVSQAPLPGEEPENAVDEDAGSQWGSGADAPQWIEVDLGEPHTVRQIRLLVAQYPAGETQHVVRVAGPDHAFTVATEFAGSTDDNDWLAFEPDNPLIDVQYVRIETVRSPSWVAWKEVQVIGD